MCVLTDDLCEMNRWADAAWSRSSVTRHHQQREYIGTLINHHLQHHHHPSTSSRAADGVIFTLLRTSGHVTVRTARDL